MLRNPALHLVTQLPKNAISQTLTRSLATATNTLIIGGGPIGLSTAYHLAINNPSTPITVIERDPTYAHASATLSAGGIRQQFSLRENIQMSLYGRDFLRNASDLLRVEDEDVDVQFQEHGYLFLSSSEKGAEVMMQNNELQRGEGADVVLMSKKELKEKFPWLNVEDIVLGSYGGEFCFGDDLDLRSWQFALSNWVFITSCAHILPFVLSSPLAF
jgi:glycine/D-amino acid oxidase-like deaminating enzyme